MIGISTPLSISSSVRDIERLLRESPPFRAGRMSMPPMVIEMSGGRLPRAAKAAG
jgi:hypothetical protein